MTRSRLQPTTAPQPPDAGTAAYLCQVRYQGGRLLDLIPESHPAGATPTLSAEAQSSLAMLADALRALATRPGTLACPAPALSGLLLPDIGRLDPGRSVGCVRADLHTLVAWAHQNLAAMPRPARRC